MHVLLSLVLVTGLAAQGSRPSKSGPSVLGSWIGHIGTPAGKIRVVFHLKKTAKGFAGTLDSPDQQAFGIAMDRVEIQGRKLKLAIQRLGIRYEGKLDPKSGKIVGTFHQAGDLRLILRPLRGKIEKPPRPQEPKPPFPYRVEEVRFESAPGVRLAGSLTLPKGAGPFPALVLVTGSGPQDRNESLMGHKPFLVLADALTRRGIAVLRYDDRGVGKSTGKFAAATTQDFAVDALAAVSYLKGRKEIDPKKIGICGHSEGGLVAPICAAKSKDVAFMILLAGPAVSGAEILKAQGRKILRVKGVPEFMVEAISRSNAQAYDLILKEDSLPALRKKLKPILEKAWKMTPRGKKEDFVAKQTRMLLSPWFRAFVRFDPRPYLAKLDRPILVLNGSKDVQVLAEQNLPVFRKLLARNKDATIIELPGLNHLFQTCKTGDLGEYGKIEETMAPKVLKTIGDWILARFGK
ncbi:MAG TPA: alpha/beta fold hydrolase [Planctomycetes bacterium]|nr:alpha/beta fold hydrolase [Planctomycetota bacterium]